MSCPAVLGSFSFQLKNIMAWTDEIRLLKVANLKRIIYLFLSFISLQTSFTLGDSKGKLNVNIMGGFPSRSKQTASFSGQCDFDISFFAFRFYLCHLWICYKIAELEAQR